MHLNKIRSFLNRSAICISADIPSSALLSLYRNYDVINGIPKDMIHICKKLVIII